MKRKTRLLSMLLCCVLLLGLLPVTVLAEDGDVAINDTNFPDANFRAVVSSEYDKDSDGILSVAEIASVKQIICKSKSISSLQGIEYFTELNHLDCRANKLTSLDASQNTKLKWLCIAYNNLTSIDISNNLALTDLYCDGNKLTSIDISKNTALKYFQCAENQLTSLDVSNNPALITVYCHTNQLTSLDVSKNTALRSLSCNKNQLTSLDISNNKLLYEVYCGDNQLTSLDTSNNPELKTLNCNNNQLTSLDVSNNTALETFSCDGNEAQIDVAESGAFNLSTLPGSFEVSKASEWTGGTVEGSILTVSANKVTYKYDAGNGYSTTFTMNVVWHSDEERFTVSFNANGGSGEMADVTVAYGSYTLPKCGFTAPKGKQFAGWATSANGAVISGTTITVTEDTTLYAVWEDIPVTTYTVSFNANGGSGSMDAVTVASGESYDLPECGFTAPDGKQFKGWATSATGAVISGTTITVTEDTTLYAVWEDIPVTTYTVSFNANGGSGSMDAVTVASGESYDLPECGFTAPDGMQFKGWATSADGEVISDATIAVTGDTTLYAIWEDIPVSTYTVTINAGANMALASGNANQSGLSGAMTATVYTAADGYYFPTDYAVEEVNGISVTRNSYTQITVSGTPTANTTITLAPATAKTKEDTPTATFDAQGPDFGNINGISQGIKYSLDGGITWTEHTSSDTNKAISGVSADKDIKVYMPASDSTKLDSDIQTIDVTKSATPTGVIGVACTTSENNNGKLQNVTTEMQYKKSDADDSSWTDCGGTEVTGLSNGTYYVRVKATGTVLASDYVEVTIAAYTAPPHTHCICGGDTDVGDHTSHTDVTWIGVSSLGEITGSGSYYLTDDILMNSNLNITGTVDLCLNGHRIYTQTGASYGTVKIQTGATLNVCDCSENESGLITTCRGSYAIENSGTLNLYSGSVERSSDDNEAAVMVKAGAVFNMYGGKIGGNAKAILTNGTVHASGGTVSAKRQAMEVYAGSEVTVSGNATLSVTGTGYSTIAVYGGVVNIRGGKVTNDFSAAVYVPSGESTLNISGGEISTTSSAKADTIRLNSDSVEVTVTGGSITNGYASAETNTEGNRYGWAIDVYKVKSLTISGAPVINRIYLADSYSITVGEDGLTYETPIEIHCAKCPAPVTGANDTDYSSKFTPRSSFYAIINAKDNVVLFTKAATVTYTDGVDNEEIFPDQTYNTYRGQPTPAFNGTPQRTGYDFGGWSPEVQETVTGNTTYVAQWKVKQYTITFDANGGSGEMADVTVAYGSYTLPACGFAAPEGKQFKGWATSADGKVISGTAITVTGDTTLYAVWEDILCTVSFDANGGNGEMDDVTVVYGNSYPLPECGFTAPEGKQFAGWATSADGKVITDTAIPVTGDTTLYAVWEDILCTVSFDANGGSGEMDDVTVAYGSYTLPACGFTAPEGKQFKGWAASASGEVISDTAITVTEDTTLYAVWEDILCTVSFDANGGSGEMDDVTVVYGSYTLPECGFTAPEGKEFKGWATSADGEVISDTAIPVTSDTTLYAVWEDILCTVSFDANGGSGEMDAVTVTYGDSCTLPECGFTAPEGKKFKGWATSADGEVISDTAIPVTEDITLYAIWSEPESVPATPVKPGWISWLDKIFGDWWGDEEEKCDHVYTSVVTEPTCEEKGYTTHTCQKCGDTYKDSYTDPLGHNFENGICTRCGKEEASKPENPGRPSWDHIWDWIPRLWK